MPEALGVRWAGLVHRETLDCRELPDRLETRVQLEPSELPEAPDILDQVALPGRRDLVEMGDTRDPVVPLVTLVSRVPLEIQVFREA